VVSVLGVMFQLKRRIALFHWRVVGDYLPYLCECQLLAMRDCTFFTCTFVVLVQSHHPGCTQSQTPVLSQVSHSHLHLSYHRCHTVTYTCLITGVTQSLTPVITGVTQSPTPVLSQVSHSHRHLSYHRCHTVTDTCLITGVT
jgi:hypothetical protein